MTDINLKSLIGVDWKRGEFVIGSHNLSGVKREHGADGRYLVQASDGNTVEAAYTQRDVDSLLARISQFTPDEHLALAQTIVEPIEQVVPYMEMYNIFYQDVTYGEMEDNAIPVEDTVAVAWETHQDGSARFVRSGFSWTRPSFVTYDTAMDVSWAMLRKAGWNFFARQMRRATEELARKRDTRARDVLSAALPAANVVTVAGGSLTKAAVDTVLKSSADIGFPVQRALINPGTLADFSGFTWPTGVNLPDARVEQMIRTLYITDYGGVQWYANPHAPTGTVLFGGAPNQIGWRQLRGSVRNSSDTDIVNKRDLYLIEDQEYGYYVGLASTLWEIRITA